LVYANGAAESEDVADLISQLQPPPGDPDIELAALADLAREGVHPRYRLAPLVERGVAFHDGNMPSLIRLEVERLFRAGKIRFLVCTSTLIEGVNLSCRTIVLRGPRKGMGHPMEAHDFWNLAGRAGRWGDEFQGNIICIDPEDRAKGPLHKRKNETLATILERTTEGSIDVWYAEVEEEDSLKVVHLSREARCGHLPQLFRDLGRRLQAFKPLGSKELKSQAASDHGLERRRQGTPQR
jgi:superfamily II helicase